MLWHCRGCFFESPCLFKIQKWYPICCGAASKRLFVIIQFYAVIQGHLYHFKFFGCSSSGAGQAILQRLAPCFIPPFFIPHLHREERRETGGCGDCYCFKGHMFVQRKTKWDLVERIWSGVTWGGILWVKIKCLLFLIAAQISLSIHFNKHKKAFHIFMTSWGGFSKQKQLLMRVQAEGKKCSTWTSGHPIFIVLCMPPNCVLSDTQHLKLPKDPHIQQKYVEPRPERILSLSLYLSDALMVPNWFLTACQWDSCHSHLLPESQKTWRAEQQNFHGMKEDW